MEGGVEPAVLTFTPTRDMPDTLYYQSFTTKHLGGIIRILDRCDVDRRGHRRDRNQGGCLSIYSKSWEEDGLISLTSVFYYRLFYHQYYHTMLCVFESIFR